MSVVRVRNGDVKQALKVLKRKWDVSLKEEVLGRADGYISKGQRERLKRMRGRARWRSREKLKTEQGER